MDRLADLRRLNRGHERSAVAVLELARLGVVVVLAGSVLIGLVLVLGMVAAVRR